MYYIKVTAKSALRKYTLQIMLSQLNKIQKKILIALNTRVPKK